MQQQIPQNITWAWSWGITGTREVLPQNCPHWEHRDWIVDTPGCQSLVKGQVPLGTLAALSLNRQSQGQQPEAVLQQGDAVAAVGNKSTPTRRTKMAKEAKVYGWSTDCISYAHIKLTGQQHLLIDREALRPQHSHPRNIGWVYPWSQQCQLLMTSWGSDTSYPDNSWHQILGRLVSH